MKTEKGPLDYKGDNEVLKEVQRQTKEQIKKIKQHSPGPWKKGECGDGSIGIFPLRGVTDHPIATLGHPMAIWLSQDRHEANARLIAASPEMYMAIQTAIKDIENGSYGNALAVLRFTLAKAAGR